MNLLLFDTAERLIADVETITACPHTENESGNTVSVTGYGIPRNAAYCAFRDIDGDLQFFRIMTRSEDKISHETTLYGENAFYELLTERPLIDVRPTNVTAGVATAQALAGSRWEIGTVSAGSVTASTRWYYQQRIGALSDIADTWGVRFKFRIEVSGARITHRYVDVLSAVPVWRGKRYEIGKDVLAAKYTVDKRNVVTAIIGRGKGEETGDGYGERLDFTGVSWAVADGDPVDKPLGQDYVEIPAATALYGVTGMRPLFTTKVYGDIEDARELLQATYDDLLIACEPTVSATLTVLDLESMGFPHEAARYGDKVALITDDIRYQTQITGITRDYAQRGKDTIQLGAPGSSLYTQLANLSRSLAETDRKAVAGLAVVQANQSLLKGYIDTMVTRIKSSGTTMYTDEADGSLVFVSEDGNKAVKITGNGILIASGKTAGEWNWQTAIDGAGIVAGMITSGVLQANLIKILGTDQFYWDGGNIIIQNPTIPSQQMRIGQYKNGYYGIGFTQDGGATWQTAMDFNGLNVSASGFSRNYVSEVAPTGTINLGDMWDRHVIAKTCQALLNGYTCQYLLDNYTCDELLNGSDRLYQWDATAWIIVYDPTQIVKNKTAIEQNAAAIALKASQETVDAQGQAIANAQAQLTVQAGQIASKASQAVVDEQGNEIEAAQSAIYQNAQAILSRVEKSGVVSAINQSAEAIKILAALIQLEGIVTANGYFKILEDGSMEAVNGKFSGTMKAGNWTFDANGATYTENGTPLFQILMDSLQGASVSADLTKRLFLMGKEMYFWNAATSGAVILGKDADAGYTQQCFYPAQNRTGNLGTPSHIWDTASIRAVFRESEGGLSSRKIKKGIRELKSVSKIVDALKPVTFIYRGDPRQKRHYGMIYEDTEKVAPLLCVQLRDNDDNPRNKGIDYSNLSVLLLKEVQELRKRVAALEKKEA